MRCVRVFFRLSGLSVLVAGFAAVSARGSGWVAEAGYSWRELAAAGEGKAGFTRLGAEIGVTFKNVLGTNRYATNQNILNGSGVAVGDVNGDGRAD
ncbi:MAG TPA: hypothetical protein VF773_03230, partial [Verrucomicrobiae bacterium]